MKIYIIRDETTGGVCVSLPTHTTHTVGEEVTFEERKKGNNSSWVE